MKKEINNLDRLYKFEPKNNEVNVSDITKQNMRSKELIEETVSEFKRFFTNIVKVNPNEKQIEFAKNVCSLIFAKQTNDKISLIPALCGYGKTTIIKQVLKVIVNNLWNDPKYLGEGAIVISRRIETLEDIQKYIGKNYSFLMQSINDDTLTKREINEAIRQQQAQAKKYPILLITAARAEMLDDNISNYSVWIDKKGNERKRILRLIDEKPNISNIQEVDVPYINDIINTVSKLNIGVEDRTFMLNTFNKVVKDFIDILDKYNKHTIWIHVADKLNISDNDIKLDGLCDEFLPDEVKIKYRTVKNILIHRGGLYYCEKDNTNDKSREVKRCIKSLGVNNLKCGSFKTLIFDATSKFCVDYSDSDLFQFIKIDDDRDYSNMKIFNYDVNLSKSVLMGNNKILEITAKFLINKYAGIKNIFLVTHLCIKNKLNKLLNSKLNYIPKRNPKNNKLEIPHFCATRGDNLWGECSDMVHLSFNRLREIEYIALYMSLYFDLDELFAQCKQEGFIEQLVDSFKLVKGKFENCPDLQKLMTLKMLEDFEQELFRTKLRDFNCRDIVSATVFGMPEDMINRVEARFNIEVISMDTPSEFAELRIENRKNGDKARQLHNFIKNVWAIGEVLKIKDIATKSGLNPTDINDLKRKDKHFKELFIRFKTEKNGTYIKVA